MSNVTDVAPAKRTRRVFLYNGMRLADPDPTMDPRKVKEHYSSQYPELLNATVSIAEGGIVDSADARKETWNFKEGVASKAASSGTGSGEIVHEFKKSVGTKG